MKLNVFAPLLIIFGLLVLVIALPDYLNDLRLIFSGFIILFSMNLALNRGEVS